jgi:heme-degrading monooxygenase HmoA
VGAAEADVTIVSVLPIAVREGAEDDVVRVFGELGIFERSRQSGGFRSGRLLRPLAAGEPFLVVAEWEDASAYRRWLANPAREELRADLEPLLGGEVAGGALYEEAARG